MLVFLLSLAVLFVHGQNDNHQDETFKKVLSEVLSKVNILTDKVEKMQVENANHRDETLKKVDILAETVDNMQRENTDHQVDTLRKVPSEIAILKETMAKMQAKESALEQDMQELNRSRLMEQVICFSAVKTTTQFASVGDNILFEEEVIDTHDTYNPTYGVYVIPQGGVYEVIVTLFKAGSTTAYNNVIGDLYVDNTFLFRIRHDVDSETFALLHSTSSIIQEFQAGDALHVVSYYERTYYGASSYKSSQFSAKYLGPAPSA